MPSLLMVLDRAARPSLPMIGKLLYGKSSEGFDLQERLTLLAAFEAVRQEDGIWSITEIGRAALDAFPNADLPDFGDLEALDQETDTGQIDSDDDLELYDF